MYESVLARKVFLIRTAFLATLPTNIDRLIPDIWASPLWECLTWFYYPPFYAFQVGNAVPPPLARAIGLEIRKCVYEVDSKKKKEEPVAIVEC